MMSLSSFYRPSKFASPLSRDEMARRAPSIFAEVPHSGVSDRYSFFPTIQIVDALQAAGWIPVNVGQGNARDESRQGVQRHIIRMRHADMMRPELDVGEGFPELVLLNSHDGTSSYQAHAGFFRLACANGLIVADSTFNKVSIRHSSKTLADVVEASYRVVENVPRLAASIEEMRQVQVNRDEQRALASAALTLRWEAEKTPITPEQLLTVRRQADNAPNLWNTFNAIQENLTKGGLRGVNTSGRRQRTRAIGSVTEDTKINKALWQLAEEMKRIKSVG
jgi:hypothetical protein